MRGFEEFFAQMIKTQGFNLQEFVNFMEPKFAAAGYRDTDKTIRDGNILILTETGVGDFVLSSGLIREVRRLYPDARITLLVRAASAILAETCPYVNEIVVDPQSFWPTNLFEFYKINLQTARTLLEQRFDICFACVLHPKSFFLMYMSGAKTRVTAIQQETYDEFNNSRNFTEFSMRLATHIFPYSNYGTHTADRFFSLLENMLHLPITNRKTEVWYTPADVSFVKTLLKGVSTPIYALCMGGDIPKNHYPPEKYAKFLEMILRKEPTATFVILGGGQDDLKSAEILKNAKPQIYEKNIIDLTNKLNYRQSSAILSFCDIYIGNDTGTMHAAVATGCSALILMCFGADLPTLHQNNPRRWYPYGVPNVVVQPKHALPECKKVNFYDPRGCAAPFPHCITQIEPETLYKGFKLLKKRIAAGINEPLYMS